MIPRIEKTILLIVLLILVMGLACLYSSCHQKGVFIKSEVFYKQLLWGTLGVCCLLLLSRFDYHRFSFAVIALYGVTVLSLAYVLWMGRVIMGAQRWISFGEVSFQPSELAKFVLILVLARYYSQTSERHIGPVVSNANLSKGLLGPLGITLVPAFLVLLQPDLGTAVVYLFLFFSVAFLAGISLKYLLGLLTVGLCTAPVFWHFLRGYQKSRLLVFLNPNMDPLGAGYTMIQSKIAIGSGKLLGKGWMAGTQSQLNFLAERHTDFIFSVWAEEWGFIGSLVLVILYAVLIHRILKVSEIAKDTFGRLLAAGVAAVIFFQVFVNIAMNISLCPVVGLPLPLVSYGGSSLVINLMAIGIVLNIARQK